MLPPDRSLVVVTGASGFIATHIVRKLMQDGYAVRGTVRSVSSSNAKHLQTLSAESGGEGTLELVEADLLSTEDWTNITASASYVVHCASPFQVSGKDDDFSAALVGTRRVVQAAIDTPSVKRVIVTSSIAAVSSGRDDVHLCTFTPDDWSDADKSDPYPKSKTLAEKEARQLVANQPAGRGLELVTINPGFVVGPSLSERQDFVSFDTIKRLLNGSVPAAPSLSLSIVHVDDVAEAHVRALSRGKPGGRYICWSGNLWLYEVCQCMRNNESITSYRVRLPYFRAPNFLVWTIGLCDETARAIVSRLGVESFYDTSSTTSELGIAFKSADDAVVDAALDMLQRGLV